LQDVQRERRLAFRKKVYLQIEMIAALEGLVGDVFCWIKTQEVSKTASSARMTESMGTGIRRSSTPVQRRAY
jgi:hypothetical protein